MKRPGKGFTLMEVMIAVAIIAILVAVALPAYEEQVRKSRRAEGKAALLKTVQLQERFYTASATATYSLDLAPLYGLAAGAVVRSAENPADTNGWYVLTADTTGCVPVDLTVCVRIVATPRTGFVDANCGTLTVNSRGVRTESGTQDNRYCWGS